MTLNQDNKKPDRKGALNPPAPRLLAEELKVTSLTVEWLAGDGSDRCYYRLRSPEFQTKLKLSHEVEPTLVLMQLSSSDAELLKNDGYDWINVGETLRAHGVFVPRVVKALPDHAALIIEDYGDLMLETKVFKLAETGDFSSIHSLYHKTFQVISRFLGIERDPSSAWCRRAFDVERFSWELRFFMQKYAQPIAGIDLSSAERKAFEQETGAIAKFLASESRYFVHRDFHSRNVMLLGDSIAVIDFQDARIGPAAYDLVSLCFDSYVPFTPSTRRSLMLDGLDIIRQNNGATVAASIDRLWKPMLLQRQLKAIGSFGYLTIEKGRGDYLKYVDGAVKTLEEQGLEDERWPFLSSVLIRRIRDFLLTT